MRDKTTMPFDTLESAQEFVHLLRRETESAEREIQALMEKPDRTSRQIEALRLVLFKLSQLRTHTEASSRILKDLRTLRDLLLREIAE